MRPRELVPGRVFALAQIVTCSLGANGVGAGAASEAEAGTGTESETAASIKSLGLDAINNNSCWRQLAGATFPGAVSVNSNCHYVYVKRTGKTNELATDTGKWELSGWWMANESESKVFASDRKKNERANNLAVDEDKCKTERSW